MSAIDDPNAGVVAAIDRAHEAKQDGPRQHLGCSVIGHHCERWLWLSFRWAVIEKHSGRLLRLFRRGQNEEATVIADLLAAGCTISHGGQHNQRRVELAPHVGGSLDGIIMSGLPGYERKQHVLEIKTHSKKSFDALVKDGLLKSKSMHWAQCQLYMLGTGIDRALYYAVCKDDDRVYTERVRFDAAAANDLLDKANRIVRADRIPPGVSTDPSWYQCKWCPAHAQCHSKQPTQQVNCRTCAHSTAANNGALTCGRHEDNEIPVEFQKIGCEVHVLHPDMVPWMMASGSDTEATYLIDGVAVRNGKAGDGVYGSKELIANPQACARPDEAMVALRQEFDGRIVG
jgi:hypothetical protein